MPVPAPTVDELIALLSRSRIPTLITEGVDDQFVMRRLEEKFTDIGLDFLPAGGRGPLLKIFDRRSEISSASKIAFLADRDCWVYGAVPTEYVDDLIILTDGYSVENDLYADGELERFLTPVERIEYATSLENFVSWYAFALETHLVDEEFPIKNSPSEVLDGDTLDAAFVVRSGYVRPAQAVFDLIMSDYMRVLRGKSLMALLLRKLSSTSRVPKYSKNALVEIGIVSRGPLLTKLCNEISLRY